MAVLESLEPKKVFCFFEELCKIPHGSHNTKEISDYCVDFAKKRGLEAVQDRVGNVFIRKAATAGYEESEGVIIQGHLDMVCAKTEDSTHDFMKDGLDLYVEDGYVKARGTSLGGDDGIAVAMALAVLDSDDIPHPSLEVLLTVDEEVGLDGANAFDFTQMKGGKLINIDSEEEGILTVGCAGAIMAESKIPIHREKKSGSLIRINIHGLVGGHSGSEIHKQRGNAHKMMGRLLNHMMKEVTLNLVEVNGGSHDNVIAMQSVAEILVPVEQVEKALAIIEEMKATWDVEFMGFEPDLLVDTFVSHDSTIDVCDDSSTKRTVAFLVICPNGAIEYSRKLEGLVETSLNMGIVETASDYIKTVHMLRSSVDSRDTELWERFEQCAHAVGAEAIFKSSYNAWPLKIDSDLQKIMVDTYKDMYGKDMLVETMHAGLECAVFCVTKPDLDCVSFGPNLWDVHSFNERLDIASTERCWNYLLEVLKRCKQFATIGFFGSH